jgi:hypothetical protein
MLSQAREFLIGKMQDKYLESMWEKWIACIIKLDSIARILGIKDKVWNM